MPTHLSKFYFNFFSTSIFTRVGKIVWYILILVIVWIYKVFVIFVALHMWPYKLNDMVLTNVLYIKSVKFPKKYKI